ncbi:MAG TPA: BatA domain-containing protein [Phycisphaerales bacterium]|nr:BatA domain-containing protein [Phycisphaerales bacterium]
MTFLHPILLGVGLAGVAIPIAIHLLMRRRRRPVRWAAMRFLIEAYKRKQRRLRLEQLLLLAARCLLVAVIALAIARPMVSRAEALGAGSRDLYLLLDNSLASGLTDDAGASSLGKSVEQALALLDGLESARGDRAALVLLGGEAEGVVLPPTSDLAQVERRVREAVVTDGPMDLAGALDLIASAAEGARTGGAAPVIAVLSEFREGSLGPAPVLPSVGEGFTLLASDAATQPLANVGVASAELLRPVMLTGGAEGEALGAPGQVRVRLIRSGAGADRAGASSLRVIRQAEHGDQEIGSAVVEWSPGQSEAQATVDLNAGDGLGEGRAVLRVEIDRDANERDDAAWAVLELRDRLRVALIGARRYGERARISDFGPTDWLALALQPAGDAAGAEIDVEVLDAARIGAGQLAGFDAAVIAEPDRLRPDGWTALRELRSRGAAVVLCASAAPGAQMWVEPAREALGLPWEIDLEPMPQENAGVEVAPPGAGDLLWYLRGELEALAGAVRVHRALSVRTESSGDVLLSSSGGGPLLLASTRSPADRPASPGVVALLATAVDLDWTDLPARPLMVPLVQELVRSGVGRAALGGQAIAGARLTVPQGSIELRGVTGPASASGAFAIDPARGVTREPVRRAGAYEAVDGAGRVMRVMVVQPDAAAGRAQIVEPRRVQAWLSASLASGEGFAWTSDAAGPRAGGSGSPAARRATEAGPGLALLAAALGLACVELGLARLVSHAARPIPTARAEGSA